MRLNIDPNTQRSVTWIFGLLGLTEQAVAAAVVHASPNQWLVAGFFGCVVGGETAARLLERGARRDESRNGDHDG